MAGACYVRVRSTRPPVPGTLRVGAGWFRVTLDAAEEGVAPGQAAVFYEGTARAGRRMDRIDRKGVGMSEAVGLSGLEQMRALIAGGRPKPSISETLDFVLVEVEEGRAVFEGTPTARLLDPYGIVHGGWALTLLDSCTGCAAQTTLPPGGAYTTVETKGNFVRPITPATGIVRAEGKVISAGRTIITAEGRITDANGKLLAHGTSTLLVLRKG